VKKIRIVHVISSLKIGGAEAMLCDLIGHLNADEFDNHVIHFYDGPHVDRLRRMGVPTYHITGLFSLYDPIFMLRLFWLLFRLKADCIHTSLWSANVLGGLYARLSRTPYISAVHLATNSEADDVNTRFKTLCDIFIFRGAHKIVTVSDNIAHQLKKNYQSSIKQARLAVIKNGIDHEYIHKQAKRAALTRQSLELSDRHFVIGTVGRLIPRKNHAWLIDTFATFQKKHSFARLIILGDGPLKSDLENQIKALGLSDKARIISGQSAYGFYHLFDCFALPSFSEGLSIALLEAMSFGVPPIVTSSDKMHEVVRQGKSGFIVEPMDTFDLLEAFEKLKSDKLLRKKISDQATKNSQTEFDVLKMADGYTMAFHEAHKNQI
jgi:glycosyltransferase involved in cell wall biosynthesis